MGGTTSSHLNPNPQQPGEAQIAPTSTKLGQDDLHIGSNNMFFQSANSVGKKHSNTVSPSYLGPSGSTPEILEEMDTEP